MVQLIFPLSRPQYMVAPEVLLSALISNVCVTPEKPEKIIGFTYKKNDEASATPRVHEFFPRGENLKTFDESLKENGIKTSTSGSTADSWLLGRAISNNVLGTKSLRSKSQAAAPLTPALALLQDFPGLLNKTGPADIAKIIEQIYSLGAPHNYQGKSASTRLWEAYQARLKIDPLLGAIDSSVQSSILSTSVERRTERELPENCDLRDYLKNTPFSWFFTNWNEITDPAWAELIPSRVWVDWATAVIRLGIGMSYLWEAAWLNTLAQIILQQQPIDDIEGEIKRRMPSILPWEASELAPGMRNVSSILRKRVKSAHAIRDVLKNYDLEELNSEIFPQIMSLYSKNANFKKDLVEAMNPNEKIGKNTWEAISYTLTSRESLDGFVDYYGLLRRRGTTVLEPNPGVEWMAVISSLVCGRNRYTCSAGDVLDSLQILGARPKLRDLINYLEAAGLARGSADADKGVQVERAF